MTVVTERHVGASSFGHSKVNPLERRMIGVSAKSCGSGLPAANWPTLVNDAFVDEIDDVLRGRAGEKHFSDAFLLQSRDVSFGNNAA